MIRRCEWVTDDPLYRAYHDREWGVPVHDDREHFEFLVLESAQAGLSWITILRKRENYRKAYMNFDYEAVAGFDDKKLEELVNEPGIVRNRRKIKASINNARRFIEVRNEFQRFDHYIWGFTNGKQIVGDYASSAEVPCSSSLSDTISSDLKRRGFVFIGTVIIYSYLQAVGIVNDHINSCDFKASFQNQL